MTSLERRALTFAGVPAAAAAAALGITTEALRALRDRHGRDTEDGQPRAPHRPRRAGDHLEFADWDRLMRSNRSVL